jgi:hypothetical protein
LLPLSPSFLHRSLVQPKLSPTNPSHSCINFPHCYLQLRLSSPTKIAQHARRGSVKRHVSIPFIPAQVDYGIDAPAGPWVQQRLLYAFINSSTYSHLRATRVRYSYTVAWSCLATYLGSCRYEKYVTRFFKSRLILGSYLFLSFSGYLTTRGISGLYLLNVRNNNRRLLLLRLLAATTILLPAK